ncbi:MAG: FimV/HubP family polar landmark protein [Marinobacter sp.]|uniref:FimV/HubP family polar landmark protein n=1 Tax=Marinobacter sp. TaxID=50741 RepID=UPI0034A06694
MKVRKLAIALALAGGLGSGVAQALGLGEVELQSFLNEPLDADIRLLKTEGVSRDEVFVELASQQSYERLGLTRDFFLSNLRFEVVTAPNGELMVNVTSREPVREPYLNFLLEVTWPSGRLMREYAVLVDPPIYAEESGLQEQVQATSSAASPAEPPRQQAASRAPTRQSQGQATSSSPRVSPDNTFGPTSATDTLWGIAVAVRPNESLSPQQVMLALQDLNPNAFIDGNINKLKRGEVLRIPDQDQIQTRTRAEAVRQVTAQNEALTRPAREVDGTEQAPQTAATGSTPDQSGDELRLIVPGDGPRSSEDGASAGSDGSSTGGSEADRAAALESLDESRRENEELTTRVDDLQSQVETLQRLIELKDSQLADLQAMAQAETETETETESAETTDSRMADETDVAEGGSTTNDENAGPASGDQSDSDTTSSEEATVEQATVEEATESETDTGIEAATDADTATETSVDIETDTDTDTGRDVEAANGGQEAPAPGDSAGQGDVATTNAEAQSLSGGTDAGDDTAGNTGSEMAAAPPVTQTEQKPDAKMPPAERPVDKGFLGNTIDAISNNPLYQIALGGGLVLLLLLLLLLARRNANREKAFYEQLHNESDEDSDGFDLTLDDHDEPEEPPGESDPISDADVYIAYGRLDQAAHSLETAISREPSRTDLRLKLLAVYADSQDRGAFEKQFSELETLGDEQAVEEASALRLRLNEAEAMPSIDDLESQLRSDTYGSAVASDTDQEEETSYSFNEAAEMEPRESQFDTSLESFELEDDLNRSLESEEVDESDEPIEYDVSALEKSSVNEERLESEGSLEEELSNSVEDEKDLDSDDEPLDLGDEFASLDLDDDGDLDRLPEESEDELPSLDDDELTTSEDGSLDESFLDELDAELEKVASEDSEEEALASDEDLDDLELDVSDEDLALMEEVADKSDDADEVPSLEDELDNEDDAPLVEPGSDVSDEAAPASSARSMSREIDESELGDDDDDFDFLSGTDEAATKLDLARAYIEMGDSDGARDILEEVSIEGSDEQKTEAQDLLKDLA